MGWIFAKVSLRTSLLGVAIHKFFIAGKPCKMLDILSLRANFTKCLIRYRYGRASHKCLICCLCEQILQKFAWQSINLNANLPLDCHEFARLRFANSRNDKTASHTDKFVILTCLVLSCHTDLFFVILSAAKYPKMASFLLICVDFSLTLKMTMEVFAFL